MARATLEPIEWAALGAAPDEAALQGFIEAFPDGEYKIEAEQRVAAIGRRRIEVAARQERTQEGGAIRPNVKHMRKHGT